MFNYTELNAWNQEHYGSLSNLIIRLNSMEFELSPIIYNKLSIWFEWSLGLIFFKGHL